MASDAVHTVYASVDYNVNVNSDTGHLTDSNFITKLAYMLFDSLNI